ncbi:MAG: hypothetical protein AB1391_03880 [Candidatus Micrarchaeota archaeon]
MLSNKKSMLNNKKKLFLLMLSCMLILFLGCIGGQQSVQTNQNESKTNRTISPIIILEDREMLITGENITQTSNVTNFFNKTDLEYKYEPDKPLFIFFINTSFKDENSEAILMKKGDADILIDSGSAQTSVELVNFLKDKGVDDIELLVSTNAHKGHYGGMNAIFDNIEIEQFMWNNESVNNSEYISLLNKGKNKTKKIIEAEYLKHYCINGICLQVLNPKNYSARSANVEENGIILKATDRNFCLLIMGDSPHTMENILLNSGINLSCKAIQLPNYGIYSTTSRIVFFLQMVAPEIGIITGSYADPEYGRKITEEKLKMMKIAYYETFNTTKNTTNIVRIISNGINYTILNNN